MQASRAVGGRRFNRGQGGFTLLEAVVSLALVSTVVLGLAAGMLTALRSSTSAKSTQEVDAALSAYAESFKSLDGDCDTNWADAVSVPAWLDPTSPDSSVSLLSVDVPVEYWNESDPANPSWELCSPAVSSPGVVRLTVNVEVDTTEGVQTGTGQVVVRNAP